jgi:hypothetical protein
MLLVVVNDFYVGRPGRSVSPLKAKPPLVVDANAVLALSISCQRLKAVAWKCRKVRHRCSGLHAVELEACRSFKSRECLDSLTVGKVSGSLVSIAKDQLPPQNIANYALRQAYRIAGFVFSPRLGRPFDREAVQLVVGQSGHLWLVDLEAPRYRTCDRLWP